MQWWKSLPTKKQQTGQDFSKCFPDVAVSGWTTWYYVLNSKTQYMTATVQLRYTHCSDKRVCKASWCWTICNSSHCSGSASNTQSRLLALASDKASDKLDSSQILGQHSTPWTKKYKVLPFAIEPNLWRHMSGTQQLGQHSRLTLRPTLGFSMPSIEFPTAQQWDSAPLIFNSYSNLI